MQFYGVKLAAGALGRNKITAYRLTPAVRQLNTDSLRPASEISADELARLRGLLKASSSPVGVMKGFLPADTAFEDALKGAEPYYEKTIKDLKPPDFATWAYFLGNRPGHYEALYHLLQQRAVDFRGKSFLEIGSVQGSFVALLSGLGADAAGLEANEALAAEGQRHGLWIIKGNLAMLPWELQRRTFDVTLSNNVMHTLSVRDPLNSNLGYRALRDGERRGALRNLAALTKPGGLSIHVVTSQKDGERSWLFSDEEFMAQGFKLLAGGVRAGFVILQREPKAAASSRYPLIAESSSPSTEFTLSEAEGLRASGESFDGAQDAELAEAQTRRARRTTSSPVDVIAYSVERRASRAHFITQKAITRIVIPAKAGIHTDGSPSLDPRLKHAGMTKRGYEMASRK